MNDDQRLALSVTRLGMVVAEMSDPTRYGKGRTYARQGAVSAIEIEFGMLTAQVQGSRPQPYDVVVRTMPSAPHGDLVPTRREILFDCTCPDSLEPCKHSIAVMVRFVSIATDDPAFLVRWRGQPAVDSPRATIGSRISTERSAPPAAGPSSRSPRTISSAVPQFGDAERAELAAFLGTPDAFEVPALPPLGPPHGAWDEVWASMLDDALRRLAETTPR